MKTLTKIKSYSAILLAVVFLTGTLVSACGTKSTEQTEDAAEHPEGGEHPTDSAEHPSEDSEHPAGEHPSDTTSQD